jgi:hypothetical protein
MLHRRNFTIGNVWIDRYLRWGRNGNRNLDTCDRVGNAVIGNDGNLRDDGNLGFIGNVRLRLKQHSFIVDTNVNVAHDAGRCCSNGDSAGIIRDWQSWSQFRSSRTNNDRIAHCGYRGAGTDDAFHYQCAHRFTRDDKPIPVLGRRRNVERLLKLQP